MEGELLAANVVRLSWSTRDAERSSTFSDVVDESRRVQLRSVRPNSTLQAVKLLNGTTNACDDHDAVDSLLINCRVNNHNNVMSTISL